MRALRVGERVPGGLAAVRLGAREARPGRVRGARGGPCDDGRREQVEVAHAVPRVEPAHVRAWRCLCVVVCVHGGGGLRTKAGVGSKSLWRFNICRECHIEVIRRFKLR